MMYDFKLPDIGEGVHEATILEWKRAVGDKVEEGDVLAVVETDKVVAEIPSPPKRSHPQTRSGAGSVDSGWRDPRSDRGRR